MKLKQFSIAVLLTVLAALPTFAQTATTQTTLATAITTPVIGTPPTNQVTLASGTGVALNSWLQVDSELMVVTNIANTPTFTVNRTGQGGSVVGPHAVGAVVWVIPFTSPQTLTTVNPAGVCTASAFPFLPVINARTGSAWYCNTMFTGVAQWGAYSAVNQDFRRPFTAVATNAASATNAYTVRISDGVVVLTTTGTGTGSLATAINTWTLPSHLGLAGKVLTLVDGSGGVTTTTFIALSGTVDGAGGTFSNVTLKTAYGAVQLVAGSGGWFTLSCSKSLSCK